MTDLEIVISLLSVVTLVEVVRLVMAVLSRVRAWYKGRKKRYD